ncbi:MAG: hypothetical protein IPK71_04240 [Myxococcales bacterium]|nr:hypothetical protein [Myxococcales bacterium]
MRPPLAFPLMGALALLALGVDVARAGIPPRIAFAEAPKAERSPGFPACGSSDVVGLPNRTAFEREEPPFLPPGPRHESPPEYPVRPPYSALRTKKAFYEHFPFGLATAYVGELPDGRLYWTGAKVGNPPVLPLLAFVQKFRVELGFRDGDWPELVGKKRVFRRYANGAISLRYFGAQHPELPYEAKDDKDEGFDGYYGGRLPVPADGLAAPPDLTGNQALAIIHDMNPYLELLPLEEPGSPIAARLVVVSGIDWDPHLAWEVRYKYPCWEPGVGKERPYLVSDSAYAYVDARSGALVFGRDETRGGVALSGPAKPTLPAKPPLPFCATGLLSIEEPKPAPKKGPARRR